MSTTQGQLFVITAPSGAGKTTLTRNVLREEPRLRFSVSYTTRAPRAGEQDGKDYFFVSRADFQRMIAGDELLEYAEVFGNFYGTGRGQIEQHIRGGHHVLLDIDWQGARQVRARMAESVLVFIMPPSITELERRLRSRGTDSDEVIARRLGEARDDMAKWREFDFVIVNEDVATATAALRDVLRGANTTDRSTLPAVAERMRRILAG